MFKKLIAKWKYKRFCKLNDYRCVDCIYHNFVFDSGGIFRGNRCRYPWLRGK